jgi:molybdopterin-guanine dinucleotide biosynthesis protein A
LLVGIFVGGRATRMGGIAKGMLAAPDTGEPLAARLARLCREWIAPREIVLVGDGSAYGSLRLRALADDPRCAGPLGGLVALLDAGVREDADTVALATDLPFVTPDLLRRLATHPPAEAAVAPKIDGFWQPLFARYPSEAALEVAARGCAGGSRALHRVLGALGDRAVELPLSPDEARLLDDWDSPDAIRR